MQTYILDLEGFFINAKKLYVVTEFAYINLTTKKYNNFFIKISKDIDFNKYWYISKNINHIPFDYGTVDFNTVFKLLDNNAKFYVKGKRKYEFIKSLTNSPVLNLDDINCPEYSKLEFKLNKNFVILLLILILTIIVP